MTIKRNSIILGDNPFFSISHSGFNKSREYLTDASHLEKSINVVKTARELNIKNFMISSHPDAVDFLYKCGYDKSENDLPNLSLVLPDVHSQNTKSANNGIVSIAAPMLISGIKQILQNPSSLRSGFLASAATGVLMEWISGFPKSKIEYILLHNIYVDLLIGLGGYRLLRIFEDAIRNLGYKPGFITLNPTQFDKYSSKNFVLCTYYNLNGYNIYYDFSDLQKLKKQKNIDLWAMGILASGAIEINKALNDTNLESFDKILYATGKKERLIDFVSGLK